jgi:Ca-activated chloride channel homolog
MTFLWQHALWSLLAVPCLIALYLLTLRRTRRALRYPSAALVRPALGRTQRFRRHVPPLLLGLAVLASIVAMGRPVAVIDPPSQQRTVLLVIDVSLSMGANDVRPTRLAAAQAAARTFIERQPADVRVGILTFAADADLVQPPTRDRDRLLKALDNLDLRYNTAIGSGLIAALLTLFPREEIGPEFEVFGMGRPPEGFRPVTFRARFDRLALTANRLAPGSNKSVAIVLLTDGRDTGGPPPLRAAQLAADRGVRVYTVGFGNVAPTRIEIRGVSYDVTLDEETLRAVARITDGAYYHAATTEQLHEVYQELGSRIVLERKETEIAALFAGLAGLLLVSALTLSVVWFHRPLTPPS